MLDDFLESDELHIPNELLVMDERLEWDEGQAGGLVGERLCKHTPPRAQRKPVMLAHSLI